MSFTRYDLLLSLCTKSANNTIFVTLGVMASVELPTVLVNPEPVLTRPAINCEIEILERFFLFPGHNDASAISATFNDIDGIVDVKLSLGSECTTKTHRNSVI